MANRLEIEYEMAAVYWYMVVRYSGSVSVKFSIDIVKNISKTPLDSTDIE